jgi:2C-methyl-D-erythritol 2,4-cyclodiphosphate synthase
MTKKQLIIQIESLEKNLDDMKTFLSHDLPRLKDYPEIKQRTTEKIGDQNEEISYQALDIQSDFFEFLRIKERIS